MTLQSDGHISQLQRLNNMIQNSDAELTAAFNVQMPCRLEKVNTPTLEESGVNVWLDVCHNEQGL
jgi:folylpolyglutamate synthase/dihydropteroate synthase